MIPDVVKYCKPIKYNLLQDIKLVGHPVSEKVPIIAVRCPRKDGVSKCHPL